MQQSRLDMEHMPSAGSEKLAGMQKTFLACASDTKSLSLRGEIHCALILLFSSLIHQVKTYWKRQDNTISLTIQFSSC